MTHSRTRSAASTTDPTVYTPVYGQPDLDTEARRERAFRTWTGTHGPCRVLGCDDSAADTGGRCNEHAD